MTAARGKGVTVILASCLVRWAIENMVSFLYPRSLFLWIRLNLVEYFKHAVMDDSDRLDFFNSVTTGEEVDSRVY
jgi:hypothetical protein